MKLFKIKEIKIFSHTKAAKQTVQNSLEYFLTNKHILAPVLIASFIFLYFSFFALFGSKGVIKYFSLKKELQEKNLIKNSLHNEADNKKNLVKGMNTKSLDIDLLDEQVRKNLGYAEKNEVIIYEKD